jgi:hypothetical protein
MKAHLGGVVDPEGDLAVDPEGDLAVDPEGDLAVDPEDVPEDSRGILYTSSRSQMYVMHRRFFTD